MKISVLKCLDLPEVQIVVVVGMVAQSANISDYSGKTKMVEISLEAFKIQFFYILTY